MSALFDLVGRVVVTGVDQFNRSMNQVGAQSLNFAKRLDTVGKQCLKMGNALTRGVTVPIAAVGVAVVKVGADFDKAMSRSLSIVDGVTPQIRKQFEDVAIAISKKTAFSATEVAEAFYYMASAGLSSSQVLKAMGTVALYAQAGNISLKEAAEQLTDVLGALGLDVKDATQYQLNLAHASDVLTKASKDSDATIQEFTDSLITHGGVALRLVNKSIEEGVAVLEAFARQGIKGAEAGNALHIVLRDLQTASLRNTDAWKQMGLSVYDSNGKMRNMADIIQSLEQRMAGMSDKQKRQLLLMLGFQDRSVKYIMALIGMSGAIKSYEQALRDSNGYTKQVAQATMMDFYSQLKIVQHQLEGVAITLWRTLGPALKEILIPGLRAAAGALQVLAEGFNTLPAPIRNVIYAAIALAAALGPILVVVGYMAMGFAQAIPIIIMLSHAMTAFFAICLAHPIALLITAIGLLIFAGYNLIKAYGGVRNTFSAIWNGMKSAVFGAVSSMINIVLSFVENTLKSFRLLSKIPGISQLMGLTGVKKALDNAISGIEDLKNKIKSFFSGGEKDAKAFGASFKKNVEGSIKEVSYKIPEGQKTQFRNDINDVASYGKDFKNKVNKDVSDVSFKVSSRKKTEFKTDLGVMEGFGRNFKDRLTRTVAEIPYKVPANKKNEFRTDLIILEAYGKTFKNNVTRSVAQIPYRISSEQKGGYRSDLNIMEGFVRDYKGYVTRTTSNIPYGIPVQEKSKFKADLNEMAAARSKFESDWHIKALEASGQRLQILRIERERSLAEARKLGASRVDIMRYYDAQERQIHQERMEYFLTTTQSIVDNLMGLWNDYTQARITQIEDKAQREIQAIRDSNMSEEDKARKIRQIEDRTDRQRRDLQRKQAKREKALAIFDAVINGAVAYTKALTMGPILGWIMAALIAASVAAQIALIIAKPIPFKKGGLVKGNRGGIQAEIGEGKEDELVFPLHTGIKALVDALIREVSGRRSERNRLPTLGATIGGAAAMAGGIRYTGSVYSPSQIQTASSTNSSSGGGDVHWHIGTLIADDRGLKQLERKMLPHRISENQRRGYVK